MPSLLALLLLGGCATGAPPGRLLGHSWRTRPLVPPLAPHSREEYRAVVARMEEEARQRADNEAMAMEAAVAVVHPRAWEVAERQHRVGTRLLLRLRVEEGRRLALRAREAEQGTGREGMPVEEEDFRRMLRAALRRRAWGWSGDVVVVLRRDEAVWRDEDSVHTRPPSRGARTHEPSPPGRAPPPPASTFPGLPPTPWARENPE